MSHINQINTLVANTPCCLCGTPLVDTVSLQRGIGPKCFRKYAQGDNDDADYTLAMDILQTEGSDAFGSELSQELYDMAFNARESASKDGGRKLANKLFFRAAQSGEKDFLVVASKVLRALGFTKAADAIDRQASDITLRERFDSDENLVGYSVKKSGYFPRFRRHMGWIDATRVNNKGGNFKEFHIDTTQVDATLAVCGYHFRGQSVSIEGLGRFVVESKQFDDIQPFFVKGRHAAPETVEETPAVVPAEPTIRLEENDGMIAVFTPYDAQFVQGVKGIPGRRAKFESGKFVCWRVPTGEKKALWTLLCTHYPNERGVGSKGEFQVPAAS